MGAGSRRPHRAATTAFAVLALVLGALTALTVVSQHTPRHTGDSTALRQIVELCLKGGNLTTAKTLFRAIQAKSIRDDVLREFPQLQ